MRHFIVYLVTITALSVSTPGLADSKSGTSGSNGASQQSGSTSNSSSGAAAPSATPQSGITNGTLAIESTTLAYKSLSADATLIANDVSPRLAGSKVVVGTAADVNAISQFRIVMGQGKLLTDRLNFLASKLVCHAPAAPNLHTFGLTVGGALSNASNIQTLIQTLAAMTAVNESENASAASLSDATLMADVSQKLRGAIVFVPAVVPPGLFSASNLTETSIGQMLDRLEATRESAVLAADSCTQASGSAKANAVTALIQSTSAQVDAFEVSLLSGSGAAAPATSASSANQSQPGASGQPSGVAPATTGSVLQQILYADLLLRAIGTPAGANVKFLSVHALESGGGQWTHSNLFAGSWISFSGGAVASYTLFDGNGAFQCGGIAYAYRGIVDRNWVEYSLNPAAGLAATNTGTCSPPSPAALPPASSWTHRRHDRHTEG